MNALEMCQVKLNLILQAKEMMEKFTFPNDKAYRLALDKMLITLDGFMFYHVNGDDELHMQEMDEILMGDQRDQDTKGYQEEAKEDALHKARENSVKKSKKLLH